MPHHPATRIAAAALLGVTATACLIAVPAPALGADGSPKAASPKANTVYKGDITSTTTGISGTVTIAIGDDKSKVAKMTVKLVCAGENVKMVRKNLPIKSDGSFFKQTYDGPSPFPVTQVDGKFKSKSKVKGGVVPDAEGPCGYAFMSYTAKD